MLTHLLTNEKGNVTKKKEKKKKPRKTHLEKKQRRKKGGMMRGSKRVVPRGEEIRLNGGGRSPVCPVKKICQKENDNDRFLISGEDWTTKEEKGGESYVRKGTSLEKKGVSGVFSKPESIKKGKGNKT